MILSNVYEKTVPNKQVPNTKFTEQFIIRKIFCQKLNTEAHSKPNQIS